jgi:hypothetical protein
MAQKGVYGRQCLATGERGVQPGALHRSRNGWLRRNLAVAARSGDGPFTIRFADLHDRAMQTSGLLSWRSTPWQAA